MNTKIPLMIIKITIKVLRIIILFLFGNIILSIIPHSQAIFGVESQMFINMAFWGIFYIVSMIIAIAILLIGDWWIDSYILRKIKESDIREKMSDKIEFNVWHKNFECFVDYASSFFCKKYPSSFYHIFNDKDGKLKDTYPIWLEKVEDIDKKINDFRQFFLNSKEKDKIKEQFDKIIDITDEFIKYCKLNQESIFDNSYYKKHSLGNIMIDVKKKTIPKLIDDYEKFKCLLDFLNRIKVEKIVNV